MLAEQLLELIGKGETSSVQFKENVYNEQSIAQEMVAFSNSKGGKILIGVSDKTWEILGLSPVDLRRLSDLLVNAANEHVKSPIFIDIEVVAIDGKNVLVVAVPEGVNKPYKDKDGIIFLKNGANKRKVTANEEIARLLQSSGNLYAEELLLKNSTLADINWEKFRDFYEEIYNEPCDKDKLSLYLENLNLGKNEKLNLAGALLFTDKPLKLLSGFFVAAIWFWGNELIENDYRSSENIYGTLDGQYKKCFDFILSKLHKIQAGQSFNSLGKSEIPEVVIQELLVNALIHRDYFIQDSIKIFVFENRVEIISPGKLPNNLNEAQIRRGIRKKRNNLLDSFAPALLNYRGVGSGILRALAAYPHIDFFNDVEAEQFKVTIHRIHQL